MKVRNGQQKFETISGRKQLAQNITELFVIWLHWKNARTKRHQAMERPNTIYRYHT
jgi:hypothetical protein